MQKHLRENIRIAVSEGAKIVRWEVTKHQHYRVILEGPAGVFSVTFPCTPSRVNQWLYFRGDVRRGMRQGAVLSE